MKFEASKRLQVPNCGNFTMLAIWHGQEIATSNNNNNF